MKRRGHERDLYRLADALLEQLARMPEGPETEAMAGRWQTALDRAREAEALNEQGPRRRT